MRRPIQLAIALLTLFPLITFADYGSGAVEISCDVLNDTLTIATSIKWNEDYDLFIAEHPSGSAVTKNEAVFTLDKIKDIADYKCLLRKNSFTVRIGILGSTLSVLTSDGKIIYKNLEKSLDEDIYGLSSSIVKYHLKIASDAKVIECVTRSDEKEICKPYIINR